VKLSLYIIGGVLLWLGVYGNLKSRGSAGYSPIPHSRADLVFQFCGLVGRVGLAGYAVAMVFVFKWWYLLAFAPVAGVAIGVLYSRLTPYGAGLAIICIPLGAALATIALVI
jgi:hypothetical protein